jgi:hypothetical protein
MINHLAIGNQTSEKMIGNSVGEIDFPANPKSPIAVSVFVRQPHPTSVIRNGNLGHEPIDRCFEVLQGDR